VNSRVLRARRLVFASCALAIALAACGGGKPEGSPTTPSGSTSGSPSPSLSTSPGGTTSPRPGSFTPKPRNTASPSPKGSAAGGSTAALDLACARRGVDTQGLTIHTKPGGPASYSTEYSDGSTVVEGHYSSGYGGGFADDQGNKRYEWIPPANAPLGTAIVHVIWNDDPQDFKISFKIVAQTGHC
jgi:hypothetical protein